VLIILVVVQKNLDKNLNLALPSLLLP